jgi:hypothetical protein
MRKTIVSCFFLSVTGLAAPLAASTYALITDYSFANPSKPWYFDARGRAIGSAKFHKRSIENSHMHYRDAAVSLYYSQFLNSQNYLTYGLGYAYLDLDWHKNPRFQEDSYNFAVASIGYVTTGLDKWRWVFSAAGSVDAETLDFAHSAVGYGLVWGRYHFSSITGVHIGALGYGGIRNHYVLPIVGFDFNLSPEWKLNAIFPLDISLNYQWASHWATSIAASSFGGPYRTPKRAHRGVGRFEHAIFEVYSSGVEIDLNYDSHHFITAGVGVGWDFGGWILIKDAQNRHGKYYKFDAAPYGTATLSLTF